MSPNRNRTVRNRLFGREAARQAAQLLARRRPTIPAPVQQRRKQ